MSMKILYIHNYPTRFVQIDLELLRTDHEVEERYIHRLDALSPGLLLAVAHADLVFCWFASYHALIPTLLAKLLGKPSVVVIGGYDVANLPEIGYGHQRGGWRKLISRLVMRHSSSLMVISKYAWGEVVTNAQVDPSRLNLVYMGVELPLDTGAADRRESLVLTVGNVSRENMERKGLRVFVAAAALLPQLKFAVVGRWVDEGADELRRTATPNVTFTNRVSDAELASWFRRAGVYVQVSRHEGFGLAVAEAMAYGCVPVVARVGALPEVVGEAGIYIAPPVEAKTLAEAIAEGMAANHLRAGARQRVADNFDLNCRREKLNQYIQEAYNAKRQTATPANFG